MAKKDINIGSAANDGTGDPLRTAMSKAKDNFDELYARDTQLATAVDAAAASATAAAATAAEALAAANAGGGGGSTTLAGLTDVDASGKADGKVLTYDAATDKTVFKTPSGGGAGGVSPSNGPPRIVQTATNLSVRPSGVGDANLASVPAAGNTILVFASGRAPGTPSGSGWTEHAGGGTYYNSVRVFSRVADGVFNGHVGVGNFGDYLNVAVFELANVDSITFSGGAMASASVLAGEAVSAPSASIVLSMLSFDNILGIVSVDPAYELRTFFGNDGVNHNALMLDSQSFSGDLAEPSAVMSGESYYSVFATAVVHGGLISSLDQMTLSTLADVSDGAKLDKGVLTYDKATGQASFTKVGLSQVSDFDTTSAPQDGETFVYDAASQKFKFGAAAGGGGGSLSSATVGAHRYWRMTNILGFSNAYIDAVCLREMQFLDGSTVHAPSAYYGTFMYSGAAEPASRLFDSALDQPATFLNGSSLTVDFGSPVALTAIKMYTREAPYTSLTPASFDWEFSDDGESYTRVAGIDTSSVFGCTPYSAAVPAATTWFTVPLPATMYVAGLPAYPASGGPYTLTYTPGSGLSWT